MENTTQTWLPIFYVSSSQSCASNSGSDVCESGWIMAWPNKFSPTVVVNVDGLHKNIFMPWCDRCAHFDRIVEQCQSTFRIGVVCRQNVIWKYCLYVHAHAFSHYMKVNGCIPGELYIISFFKEHAKNAHICQNGTDVFQLCDNEYAPAMGNCAADNRWNAQYPLKESQLNSVEWMETMETRIETKKQFHTIFHEHPH